ncbi:phosphonate metabolism [Alkaliphilus metalliredigens QYMF]|uniref:Phosphonate metabolism n=1 Tax=Alkaliphilus metalliredigens (strain QYMF) TaxID=293826 RepID=A6TME7_ALKMQ|nr:carbon-phosphorus lyase complex subunit PhnI [Alkaliphilus metalliredigens]ABR47365.1 phosphonate metabolism [Alkaliphilus metalliredigens QYMF]
MAYVAVKGGTKAIEASIEALTYERLKNQDTIEIQSILSGMRVFIDQVMSESSIYSKELAAIAIKQTEGNLEEAVFLLRAYRSTLSRTHYTKAVESKDMLIERRISASFKDIPGGQILGATCDYTHRLLDFNLMNESREDTKAWLVEYAKKLKKQKESVPDIKEERNQGHIPIKINEKPLEFKDPLRDMSKVISILRKENLLRDFKESMEEPKDITKENIEFPTKRSERLQILTRGQTGAVTSLGYAAIRGYGATHPTVGELRVGKLPLYIGNPIENGENQVIEDDFYIGEIKVTEVESLFPRNIKRPNGKNEIEFDVGYGICYGQNESKAIAMSVLDNCLEMKNKEFPTYDEEFVLYHIDSVESTGFISHLKLPHYVTFQSKLEQARKTRKKDVKNHDNLL